MSKTRKVNLINTIEDISADIDEVVFKYERRTRVVTVVAKKDCPYKGMGETHWAMEEIAVEVGDFDGADMELCHKIKRLADHVRASILQFEKEESKEVKG